MYEVSEVAELMVSPEPSGGRKGSVLGHERRELLVVVSRAPAVGGVCAGVGDGRDHQAPAGALLFEDVDAGTVAREGHVPEMFGHGLLGWVSYDKSPGSQDPADLPYDAHARRAREENPQAVLCLEID